MAEEEAVLTERRGRVMIITLNRPDAMNAINGALSQGLLAAIRELDADPDLTAGVLTGNGRAFCAGMDLKAFARGEDIGPLNVFIREGCEKPHLLRLSLKSASAAGHSPSTRGARLSNHARGRSSVSRSLAKFRSAQSKARSSSSTPPQPPDAMTT